MPVTHYEILEIQNDADEEAIQNAFDRNKFIWHPDKYSVWADASGIVLCAEVFKRVQTAYEVLINPQKKSDYDFSLKIPVSKQIETQEKLFRAQWENLKKAY